MGRYGLGLVLAIAALALLMFASVSHADTSCGTVMGNKIVVTGGLSCAKAKYVFRRYKSGKSLPRGWTCAASARSCFKGSQSFTFGFN